MLAVLGCGNMATAIVEGYYRKHQKGDFLTFTPDEKDAIRLAEKVKGRQITDLKEIEKADQVMVACKPQHFASLCKMIGEAGVDLSSKHIISIMAAVPAEIVADKLGCKKVTRVMPNTPCFVGEGMCLLLHTEAVSDQDKSFVETFFQACGKTINISSEKLFDQVTTVSGSGPAYVFQFAQAMSQQLQSWGLPQDESEMIVTQLFKGSSHLMEEEKDTPLQTLIDRVTSKKGVTIEAVEKFREKDLEGTTSEALLKAAARSIELTKEVSDSLNS